MNYLTCLICDLMSKRRGGYTSRQTFWFIGFVTQLILLSRSHLLCMCVYVWEYLVSGLLLWLKVKSAARLSQETTQTESAPYCPVCVSKYHPWECVVGVCVCVSVSIGRHSQYHHRYLCTWCCFSRNILSLIDAATVLDWISPKFLPLMAVPLIWIYT